jgi:crossover junction endodeoxyribonuclease RusA
MQPETLPPTPSRWCFTVLGDPAPKGSAKAFVRGNRAIITNASPREKPWAQAVHWAALEHGPTEPLAGPMAVHLIFRMPRPGRLGKRRIDVLCDRRPDLDKLERSVLDALTGVFWVDDSQVVQCVGLKLYANWGKPSGVQIALGPFALGQIGGLAA